jgi:arylsulfatase A-like enzyme
MSAGFAIGLLVAALAAPAACDARPLREVARLVPAVADRPLHSYTLADETRPVLAPPPEEQLRLAVPSDQGEAFTFALPAGVTGDGVIASGTLERDKRIYVIRPTRLAVETNDAGERRVTLPLPVVGRGPGQPPVLTLALTSPPPREEIVETRTDPVAVPIGSSLHFAYGLSDAAAVDGAGAVTFEVAAVRDGASPRAIWSATVTPGSGLQRWYEASVQLAALGGDSVAFAFRARAAGDHPAVLVPLWGDPTLVAPGRNPSARRNVVVISLDTLRADRIGVYGSYRPTTPALDTVAGEAAVFTNAWAPWPETSGSHMSLFTSRFPSEHGVIGFITAPATSIELLAERLRRSGYLTRAFTEDGGVWALAGFARGFSAYSERRSHDYVYRGEAHATFTDAARWLETHTNRTFFLFVHTYEVHAPYAPQAGYRTLFTDVPGREPDAMRAQALDYDREARHLDDELGRLLGTLRRLDLADRTIVIVTSDHGEEFGEHGGLGHGRTLYREVLQVPLIVWAPGLVPAARLEAPVSLIDVAPTVLDLLELEPDPGHRGRSLAARLRGGDEDDDPPRSIFSEVNRVDRGVPRRAVSVRREGRTAIKDLTGGVLRCYGADDPAEQRPTAECPDLLAEIEAHQAAMQPTTGENPKAIDPRLIEKMRALGYLD